jgi:iron complex transport system substrate-binding protein
MRVVSLLPSATEIVCLLGLEHCLAGISHVCDYPPSVQNLPRVTHSRLTDTADSSQIDRQVRELAQSQTALYELDREVLRQLSPDLIITQSLCSVCAVSEHDVLQLVRELAVQPEVVRLNPQTLTEVIACVSQVGQSVGTPERALELVAELEGRVAAVRTRSQGVVERPRVLLLEWIDPLFCAGHWNPELVHLAGGHEVLGQAGAPSRQLAWDEILEVDPDVMVIACCGHSIDRTLDDLPALVSNPGFARLKCIGNGQVYLVDGSQYFNRPGPRLVDSLELLAHTLHPQLHLLPEHLEPAVRMKREPRPARGV